MTKLLVGKVAAITGGVTGIGRAIALEYLKHGARVAVNHFPDPKSAADFETMLTEAGNNSQDILIGVPGDIAQPETGSDFVTKVVERFGRLDIFVSNAGVCQFQEFLRYAPIPSYIPPNNLEPSSTPTHTHKLSQALNPSPKVYPPISCGKLSASTSKAPSTPSRPRRVR